MSYDTYSISPSHYNDIPEELLQGEKKIIEFGPATGLNQLISKHSNFFATNNRIGNYLGIEIESYDDTYLTIEKGDIRTYVTKQKFDVVLALHVLEHIELGCWSEVCERLMSMTAPLGNLIIGVPHNEPENTSKYHLVSRISPEMIISYLPNAQVYSIKTRPNFIEDGASLTWALLRYIKRRITRHPYVRKHARLLAIWKKESDKE